MNQPLIARASLAVLALALGSATLAQTAAPAPGAEPRGHMEQGVWVPEGNTLAEVLEQKAANQAAAEAAEKQTTDNAARIAAYEQAKAAYEAELARVEQERAAIEAETARRAADHDAAMAKWRADVAACEGGDKSRCAKPAEN